MVEVFHFVALDLDGTLLDSAHNLSEENKELLQELSKDNIPVIIATGRSAGSVYAVAKQLDLGKHIPLVCTNGTTGKLIPSFSTPIDCTPPAVLFNFHLAQFSVELTLALALRIGYCVQYYLGDVIYVNTKTSFDREVVEMYSTMTSTKQVQVNDDFRDVMSMGLPSKLLIMCGEANIEKTAAIANEELGRSCHIIHGTPSQFVEVLDRNANKGQGLKAMCKHLGYDMDHCIAIGDGNNDVEFVEFAGKGIAMQNATQALKNAANEVSPWNNDQNGVAKLLRQFRDQGQLKPKVAA